MSHFSLIPHPLTSQHDEDDEFIEKTKSENLSKNFKSLMGN